MFSVEDTTLKTDEGGGEIRTNELLIPLAIAVAFGWYPCAREDKEEKEHKMCKKINSNVQIWREVT